MEIAAVAAQDAMAGTRRASRVAEDGASFDVALEEQARLAAARDLLASLPPPVAQQIAQRPASEGPPLADLGELLEAVRDGSFVPGERELRSPFWRALDQAAAVFDGPDAMWATMRQILGSRDALASAVAHARAPQPGQPGETAAAGDAAEAFQILGGALPAWQLEWWEWTLEHILLEDPEPA